MADKIQLPGNIQCSPIYTTTSSSFVNITWTGNTNYTYLLHEEIEGVSTPIGSWESYPSGLSATVPMRTNPGTSAKFGLQAKWNNIETSIVWCDQLVTVNTPPTINSITIGSSVKSGDVFYINTNTFNPIISANDLDLSQSLSYKYSTNSSTNYNFFNSEIGISAPSSSSIFYFKAYDGYEDSTSVSINIKKVGKPTITSINTTSFTAWKNINNNTDVSTALNGYYYNSSTSEFVYANNIQYCNKITIPSSSLNDVTEIDCEIEFWLCGTNSTNLASSESSPVDLIGNSSKVNKVISNANQDIVIDINDFLSNSSICYNRILNNHGYNKEYIIWSAHIVPKGLLENGEPIDVEHYAIPGASKPCTYYKTDDNNTSYIYQKLTTKISNQQEHSLQWRDDSCNSLIECSIWYESDTGKKNYVNYRIGYENGIKVISLQSPNNLPIGENLTFEVVYSNQSIKKVIPLTLIIADRPRLSEFNFSSIIIDPFQLNSAEINGIYPTNYISIPTNLNLYIAPYSSSSTGSSYQVNDISYSTSPGSINISASNLYNWNFPEYSNLTGNTSFYKDALNFKYWVSVSSYGVNFTSPSYDGQFQFRTCVSGFSDITFSTNLLLEDNPISVSGSLGICAKEAVPVTLKLYRENTLTSSIILNNLTYTTNGSPSTKTFTFSSIQIPEMTESSVSWRIEAIDGYRGVTTDTTISALKFIDPNLKLVSCIANIGSDGNEFSWSARTGTSGGLQDCLDSNYTISSAYAYLIDSDSSSSSPPSTLSTSISSNNQILYGDLGFGSVPTTGWDIKKMKLVVEFNITQSTNTIVAKKIFSLNDYPVTNIIPTIAYRRNQLGINTSTPSTAAVLDIQALSAEKGNIYIRTTDPSKYIELNPFTGQLIGHNAGVSYVWDLYSTPQH